ncbi:MAG: DUF3822 family protein [Bacteroidota bacterium]
MENSQTDKHFKGFVSSDAGAYTLCMEIGLHGFSAAVTHGNELLFEEQMLYPQSAGIAAQSDAVVSALKKNDILYASFKEVKVVFSHPYFSLVPKEYHLKAEPRHWLNFQQGADGLYHALHNDLEKPEARLFFSVMPEWQLFVKRYFGDVSTHHALAYLIPHKLALQTEGIVVWSYVLPGAQFLLVTNGDQLLFANYFDVPSPEDFAYSVLMVYEVLSLNAAKPCRIIGRQAFVEPGIALLRDFLPNVLDKEEMRADKSSFVYSMGLLP